MKRIKRYKHIAALLFLIDLVALGLYFGALYFIKVQNETSSGELSAAESLEKKRLSLEAAENLLVEVKEEMEKVNAFFVSADGVEFFQQIESLAKTAGAQIEIRTESVNTEAIPDQKAFELLTLSIDVSGGWQEVMRFVELVETLPIELKVTNATFGKVVETSESYWEGGVRLSVVKLK